MRELTDTSRSLEIAGPRNQGWRPALDDLYRPARRLTELGLVEQAIEKAEDDHIAHHGDMHGVRFRVVTKSTTVTFKGRFTDEQMDGHPDVPRID